MDKIMMSKEFLNELLSKYSRILVGRVMKRCEITDDIDSLKKELKELIYENFRDFGENIISFTCGITFIEHNPKKKK